LTILKFVVRSSEVVESDGGWKSRKIFRDDFHRNLSPVSVFNSKVMSGIMRVIVVDAIQAEWMVLLEHFKTMTLLKSGVV
jgi:hypothetical protein